MTRLFPLVPAGALLGCALVAASLAQAASVGLQSPVATQWETTPLWRGDGYAVALSTTQAGWASASVDHAQAESGRGALYTSLTLGADWEWRRSQDTRGMASPGSLLHLPNGILASGGLGMVHSTRFSSGQSWGASGLPTAFQESAAHQIASSRVSGSPVLIAVRSVYYEGTGGVVAGSANVGFLTDVTPASHVGQDATAVAMHPAVATRKAVALRSPQGVVSVLESTNQYQDWDELEWQPVHSGLPAGRRVSAMTYLGDDLVVALEEDGLYRRTGAAWTRVGGNAVALRTVHRLHVSYADPQTLFAATSRGLSVSRDGGATWRHGVSGTANIQVHDVATGPLDPDVVLLAAAGVGTLASVDGGDSFLPSAQGINDAEIGAVAASQLDPLRLAVSVRDRGRWRIAESVDGGNHWQLLRDAPLDVEQLWFDPEGTLWSTAKRADGSIGLHQRQGARGWWRSARFSEAESSVTALAFDPDIDGLIWAGGSARVGGELRATAWRSTDGGHAWVLAWTGPAGHAVASVGAVPGSQGEHVLVSTDRQSSTTAAVLRFSLDAGQTWEEHEWTPWAEDWSAIEMCMHPANGGTAELHFRVEEEGFFGESTLLTRLEEIQSGGVWDSAGDGYFPGLLRAPQCRQEGGQLRVYTLRVRPTAFDDVVLRTTATGGRTHYGTWSFLFKRATRGHALAFNANGAWLASDRGLFRNPAAVDDSGPQNLSVTVFNGRAQRSVNLSWEGGGEWVDILRNGEVVATVPNSGSYAERLPTTPAALEYQVCNGFGEACSALVSPAP